MDEAPENRREVAHSAADHRPWQFSLAALFVLTTICAILCSLAKSIGPFGLLLPLLLLPVWDILRYRSTRGSRPQKKIPKKAGRK